MLYARVGVKSNQSGSSVSSAVNFKKASTLSATPPNSKRIFPLHARIADALGYKISVHSGSDKFRVFPLVGQYTRLRVHVKTAGTSWLEALRVIARVNPALYRRMQARAVAVLPASRRLYHISGDPALLVPLERIKDEALDTYLDEENARQILHIAYGQLLTDKDESGKYLFREEFFQTLFRHESNYADALKNHIGRHIAALKNL